ncbi:hypothetical protein SAMN05421778_1042 [Sphaerotilus natans]|uniref:DUF6973 domain-containing protein n=1 Tax=Sphaerotilus natans TaxID=34103 RepID=UPI000956F60B|nr:hypothetical protein [Sphaerotilus natans]SIQ63051.1 hypothetical protein SAMN05421778_1042 [Sphaerotilus natans]
MEKLEELHQQADFYADQFGLSIQAVNSPRDAFRHAYASAVLARDWGAGMAESAGMVWELIGLLTGQSTEIEARMDIWNNSVGRDIQQALGPAASNTQIANAIKGALDTGRLITNPAQVRQTGTTPISYNQNGLQADIDEFSELGSWLFGYDVGTDFYQGYPDPDMEADYKLARFKHLAQKLGINSITYDPIENRVTFGIASPIVLDIDDNGIQTYDFLNKAVDFDINGDGAIDKTAWISSGDAFLAIDQNGNNRIDGVNELFGGLGRGDGFAKLTSFDENRDGRVDQSDGRFSELLIWQDKNSDGVTDDGELRSAEQSGLQSIDTVYTIQNIFQQGNLLGEASTASWQGRTIDVVDVYFQFQNESALKKHHQNNLDAHADRQSCPPTSSSDGPMLLDAELLSLVQAMAVFTPPSGSLTLLT